MKWGIFVFIDLYDKLKALNEKWIILKDLKP